MSAADPAFAAQAPALPPRRWDVFCRVIDNHGDLGVCWRLSRQLAAQGHAVRLWVDDARALAWMAPGALQGGVPGVQVRDWAEAERAEHADTLAALPVADVWVEAFGCELPAAFVAAQAARVQRAGGRPPVWINLEYLSAEGYVERMHALPSPVLRGPAAGWGKWFFYPGFTPATGGLLREPDLPARQAAFDRAAWLAAQGIAWQGERVASLFCYEPPALAAALHAWRQAGSAPLRLLVTHGRAAAAVREILGDEKGLDRPSGGGLPLLISYLPALPQTAYDELLWACDVNFVRGEDSLVRALWAGRPFVWHIYPQPEDDAHHAKLDAFLHWLQAPAGWRRFHHAWNGVGDAPLHMADMDLPAWQAAAQAARQRLLAQVDLCTQLQGFVQGKG